MAAAAAPAVVVVIAVAEAAVVPKGNQNMISVLTAFETLIESPDGYHVDS